MSKTQVIEERAAEPQTKAEAPTCQHHWIIETPRGSLSAGRCKRCGEQRDFRNSATDHLWEDESGSGYNAWRGARTARKTVSDDDEAAAAPAGNQAMIA